MYGNLYLATFSITSNHRVINYIGFDPVIIITADYIFINGGKILTYIN